MLKSLWFWGQVTSPTSNISLQHHIISYYVVLWGWWPMIVPQAVFSKKLNLFLNLAPGWISCLQNEISVTKVTLWHIVMLLTDWNFTNMQKNVTSILFASATAKDGHQHNNVTNITVPVTKLGTSLSESKIANLLLSSSQLESTNQ